MDDFAARIKAEELREKSKATQDALEQSIRSRDDKPQQVIDIRNNEEPVYDDGPALLERLTSGDVLGLGQKKAVGDGRRE